jgi:hypothetical protein
MNGDGPPTRSSLSASAVIVERLDSMTSTRPGSGVGKPRKSGQAPGSISKISRMVASNGLNMARAS